MDNPPAKYTGLVHQQKQSILKKKHKTNKGKEQPKYAFYIPLWWKKVKKELEPNNIPEYMPPLAQNAN